MPDGTTYSYAYDNNNQLTSLTIPGVGNISYPSYTLTHPDSVTFPGGNSQSYQYDALMRLEQIVSSASGMDYQYTSYDGVSNILTKTTEHGNYTYSYDAVSRLLTADNPVVDDEAFTYDGVGNRETASNVTTGSITHNANNELTVYGDISYDYDANGNLIQKQVGTAAVNYIYDAANRLIKVEDDATQTVIAEYYYDPFGRRLWKDVGGTRTYFLYADEGLVAEYDASGTEIRSYGYQPDSTWTTDPLFLREGSEYYWYHNDHVGTPQKLVDSTGIVVWSAQYSAFGEADVDVETITNNLRFPGQYADTETGLYYNYFRYYDPKIGRYLRVDPIGFEAGDVNWYAYVWNNPLQSVDPTGLGIRDLLGVIKDWLDYSSRPFKPTPTRDPIFDAMNDAMNSVAQAQDTMEAIAGPLLDVGTSFACEPYDWGSTIYSCVQGDCSWLAVAGTVTPFVSGKAVGKIPNILNKIPLSEAKKLLSYWDKSSFGTLAESIRYHAAKHGFGDDIVKYLRKSVNFNKKGATKKILSDGAIRWTRKSGEYLIEKNGKIVSYGLE